MGCGNPLRWAGQSKSYCQAPALCWLRMLFTGQGLGMTFALTEPVAWAGIQILWTGKMRALLILLCVPNARRNACHYE